MNKGFSKADSFLKKCFFCLSVLKRWMMGKIIANSDQATCWDDALFDVGGNFWLFSRRMLSSWTVVLIWFNCLNNCFCSSSCLGNKWFAASIPFRCCSFQRPFSTWNYSNENTSQKSCCSSRDGFWNRSVKTSVSKESWFCRFAVDFVVDFQLGFFGSPDVGSSVDQVPISVELILSRFSFSGGDTEFKMTVCCLSDMMGS